MDVKTIKKYSDKSVSNLLLLATNHFNEYIRLRDTENGIGQCISCKKVLKIPSAQAQAGHYYSAGNYPMLRFDESNVHLQCKKCNYFLSGNLLEYQVNLVKKISIEKVKWLDYLAIHQKKTNFKWDRFYLIEIIEKYKKKKKEVK